jgi:two-component system sensor histidine kinase VicK
MTTTCRLARHDAGKQEVRATQVDLGELVPAAVASTRWMLGAHKRLEVATDVAEALPPVVTDRGKLAQVVINLVANAFKFTPEGGHVRVSARAAGDDRAIEVADDGPGIGGRAQYLDEFARSTARWSAATASGLAYRWSSGWSTCWAATSSSRARSAAAPPSR